MSSSESSLLSSQRGKYSKYGSTKKDISRVKYAKHMLSPDDSITSLAIKFNITPQELRQANKIWNDAELGLKTFLLIPLSDKAVKEEPYAFDSELDLVPVKESSKPTSSQASISRSKSEYGVCSMNSVDSDPMDFLKRFDTSLQTVKLNVKRLEKSKTLCESPINDGASTSSARSSYHHHAFPRHGSEKALGALALGGADIPVPNGPDLIIRSNQPSPSNSKSKALNEEYDRFYQL